MPRAALPARWEAGDLCPLTQEAGVGGVNCRGRKVRVGYMGHTGMLCSAGEAGAEGRGNRETRRQNERYVTEIGTIRLCMLGIFQK